jgi:hypothetical protein
MEKGEEVITLTITTRAFEELYNMGLIDLNEKEYKIKRVEPHEVEYPNDPVWVNLKKASNEAYKELKTYEYNKRHE